MAEVKNCIIPEDLFYLVRSHVWARAENGTVVVGITDVAQNLAQRFIAYTPKKVGRRVEVGKSTATLESGKWVGPVPSPVAGEILAVNEAALADPSIVNRAPYAEGWIAKVTPDDWDRDRGELLSGDAALEEYARFMDEEGIECPPKG
jgi:glycine cleavage system H protein